MLERHRVVSSRKLGSVLSLAIFHTFELSGKQSFSGNLIFDDPSFLSVYLQSICQCIFAQLQFIDELLDCFWPFGH